VENKHTRKVSDSWKIHFTKREILFIPHSVFLGSSLLLLAHHSAGLMPLLLLKRWKQKGMCLQRDYSVTPGVCKHITLSVYGESLPI
jgi:hypothetical protein